MAQSVIERLKTARHEFEIRRHRRVKRSSNPCGRHHPWGVRVSMTRDGAAMSCWTRRITKCRGEAQSQELLVQCSTFVIVSVPDYSLQRDPGILGSGSEVHYYVRTLIDDSRKLRGRSKRRFDPADVNEHYLLTLALNEHSNATMHWYTGLRYRTRAIRRAYWTFSKLNLARCPLFRMLASGIWSIGCFTHAVPCSITSGECRKDSAENVIEDAVQRRRLYEDYHPKHVHGVLHEHPDVVGARELRRRFKIAFIDAYVARDVRLGQMDVGQVNVLVVNGACWSRKDWSRQACLKSEVKAVSWRLTFWSSPPTTMTFWNVQGNTRALRRENRYRDPRSLGIGSGIDDNLKEGQVCRVLKQLCKFSFGHQDRYALPHAAATNVVTHYQFTHLYTHPLSPFATVTLIAYINDSSLSTSQSKYLACAPLATEVLLLIQTPVTFAMTHYSLYPPICVAYSLPSLRTVHSLLSLGKEVLVLITDESQGRQAPTHLDRRRVQPIDVRRDVMCSRVLRYENRYDGKTGRKTDGEEVEEQDENYAQPFQRKETNKSAFG
ncbi:hypothetical protein PLEOSDRAFT_165661 [Pleurotus ostreatus PC15]|uniref:Uncharacterized protein n=1 Tax=Pleurotus ostreatus (strain PC15) TaxID=1137138 RepID=A0A067P0P9_PLEO1|nr:hypothetical protein PLEOSDRAFT_165661 [Pleurotus ostreatus PC15]